ncbi:fimbrial protein [Burkholderia sp. AU33545]|uniref:fimbrial protein n=1 Tax=Burkholderia sp. AU33545 TaxID=2879631 RepID=UPI001CF441F1|nr:fimbrial protein [Burkholderia sp. AU33545]MCA8205846.1 fimbrial protein [Burkholderia sp. AU33545]
MKAYETLSTKLLIGVACIFAILPASAWSVCKVDTNDGLSYYTATMSGFNPPPFDPNSVPIGGVIYSATLTSRQITNNRLSGASAICQPTMAHWLIGSGTPNGNIYPTSVKNIGIRLTNAGHVFPYKTSVSFANSVFSESFSLKLELIKTGDITAGGTLSGSIMQDRAGSADGQLMLDTRFASPVIIQPQVPTCKVATPDVIVPMGAVLASSFKGVGTTSVQRPFNIALTCSGGKAGTSTNAYVTLTDATASANSSTTLSLSKDSTASGIGVQIMKDGAPLGFGPDSTAVGNTNQWYAGNIAQGQANLTIPLSARYVQTGATVSPGSANARATFTFSYQ